MLKRLTPAFVLKAPLPTTGDRIIYWDSDPTGFGLMVTARGRRSFVLQYRVSGRSRRITFKPGLSLIEARKEARKLVGDIAKGGDPMEERRKAHPDAENALRTIAEEYFKREGGKLRSIDDRRAVFQRVILPKFGGRQIGSIKRSEIVRWLDSIEDKRGPASAQKAYAYLSKLFNWHATRDDDFLSPVVRGMSRVRPGERARDRILSDDELRALWLTAEATPGPFGAFVRVLLLTATRRNECARMSRSELDGDTWVIPSSRMKSKTEHVVPLSVPARAILDSLPILGEWIFTADGKLPIRGWGKFKTELDKRSGVTGWVLHDLRRTARSLMSRASVDADVAERCLAHSIRGTRSVYDRHSYVPQKAAAFEALAAQIERILHPAMNVVPLRTA
jgi:integrase